MGYLVCQKCRGYYKLQLGELPEDFTEKCACGGKLRYAHSIDVVGENTTFQSKKRNTEQKKTYKKSEKKPPKTEKLTKCPDCGHDVSKNADKCPNCGNKLKDNSKEWQEGILALCGLIFLVIFLGWYLTLILIVVFIFVLGIIVVIYKIYKAIDGKPM